MSKIEVNAIEPQCGTTLTLGASGDTVTLASGASQSGFGRTGTVDWNTTKKTADFTATNGDGFFVDTNSGVITATLPASPSAGNIVAIKDYQGTFGTNKCTVARNGSNIRGAASNFDLSKNNAGAVFIYVDATEGWQVFIDGSDGDAQTAFITATGGTITTVCTNFKVHTFTGPGTFCVSCSGDSGNEVSYVVVAGGGGSGSVSGGGGGAGGYREGRNPFCSYTASPLNAPSGLVVTAQAYPITVGGGGSASGTRGGSDSTNGSNSVFSTITSTGGGRGGTGNAAGPQPRSTGGPGGSGGGSTYYAHPPSQYGAVATGNTPSVSPPQGNNASPMSPGTTGCLAAGGGGGATAAGGPTSCQLNGGPGGAGATSSINGTPTARAGGGGGGTGAFTGGSGPGCGGAGGTGGGGSGTKGPSSGGAGTANTGGGAGGSGYAGSDGTGSAGGSGIVIIRYRFQ